MDEHARLAAKIAGLERDLEAARARVSDDNVEHMKRQMQQIVAECDAIGVHPLNSARYRECIHLRQMFEDSLEQQRESVADALQDLNAARARLAELQQYREDARAQQRESVADMYQHMLLDARRAKQQQRPSFD